MSEDKEYHVLQLLECIEGLTGKNPETDSRNISVNRSSGRKFGPLAGGLIIMVDDFDETILKRIQKWIGLFLEQTAAYLEQYAKQLM